MANFKTLFLYQEPWEAERFESGVGPEMEVVGFPQGTDLLEVGGGHPETVMVVGGGGVRSAEVADLFPRLQLIQTLSAGTDTIPKIEMSERGVRVANNMGGNAVAVAEVTVALIVSTYRRLMVQWNDTNNKGVYGVGTACAWHLGTRSTQRGCVGAARADRSGRGDTASILQGLQFSWHRLAGQDPCHSGTRWHGRAHHGVGHRSNRVIACGGQ